MNVERHGGLTRAWTSSSSKADVIAFLQSIEGDSWVGLSVADLPDTDVNTDAFRRLSTCEASCGCTGYSPRPDCPDPACYCNTKGA